MNYEINLMKESLRKLLEEAHNSLEGLGNESITEWSRGVCASYDATIESIESVSDLTSFLRETKAGVSKKFVKAKLNYREMIVVCGVKSLLEDLLTALENLEASLEHFLSTCTRINW